MLITLHKKESFPLKIFFRKCDQCDRIWSHLLKKFLMESVICVDIFGYFLSSIFISAFL